MDVYHRRVVVTIACALLVTGSVFAQTARLGDTAQSASLPLPSSVKVAEGVSLEVIDWGGRGQTVVFLPGFGNTAHVFDQFAPQFSDTFRVIGITRRGFGASTRPATGYGLSQRSDDLLAALNALKLNRPILIGHSLAGDEMSALAARQPNRVAGLVYLDAAYDHTAEDVLAGLPRPPQPSENDLADLESFQAFWFRTHGWTYPTSELDQYDKFGDPPPEIQQAILANPQSPPFASIHAPALAIYAIPRSGREVLAIYDLVDAAAQRKADTVWPNRVVSVRAAERQFKDGVRNRKVLEIPGASHYVFFTHPSETARAIRQFLEEIIQRR